MSRRDFFQLFCIFYNRLINRKCAKEKKQQYLMLYQTWNRTSVYFKLADSASYVWYVNNIKCATLTAKLVKTIGGSVKIFILYQIKKKPQWAHCLKASGGWGSQQERRGCSDSVFEDLKWYRVIVLSCHHIIMSSCHRVMVSLCHNIIISFPGVLVWACNPFIRLYCYHG